MIVDSKFDDCRRPAGAPTIDKFAEAGFLFIIGIGVTLCDAPQLIKFADKNCAI